MVSFDPNIGLFKYASTVSELEDLLKRRVDLVTETALFPWVKTVSIVKKFLYMREKPKDRGRLLHINEAIANIHNLLTSKARVPDSLKENQAHALYYLSSRFVKKWTKPTQLS